MILPALINWTDTRTALHQAAQVIGGVRAAVAPPEPNYLHLGLSPIPEGLTTGALPGMGELVLDFGALAVFYHPPEHDPVGFALARHSQVTLADALEEGLSLLGHPVTLKRDKVAGTAVFHANPDIAAAYARVLARVTAVLDRVQASLPGQTSRVTVWPHGFDMSFLWFATDNATEFGPHMSFGFSPYSDGFERPYVYAYAHPVPAGMTLLHLEEPAYWYSAHWTGAVIPYDSLIGVEDPDAVIEQQLRAIHAAVAPLLGG